MATTRITKMERVLLSKLAVPGAYVHYMGSLMVGQVYRGQITRIESPAFLRLIKKGFVSNPHNPAHHVITEAGRNALAAWQAKHPVEEE